MICIYIATNLDNGKQYVGQAIDFKRRLQDHLKNKGCSYFDNSLRCYGIEKFDFIKLEYDREKLDYWEKFWIAKLNTMHPNGYNLTSGGDKVIFCEETRNKMSKSMRGRLSPMKGKHHTEETRDKMRKASIGKTLSDITKLKLSESHKGEKNSRYGKKHSTETKEKIRQKLIGRIMSPETKWKMSKAGLNNWIKKRSEPQVGRSQIAGY